MTAPEGFEPLPLEDERRIHYTHRRRVPQGYDYWPRRGDYIMREVRLSDYAVQVTYRRVDQ